ncbi:MAG: RNase adapter RapZ [Desulfobacterales bacterium]
MTGKHIFIITGLSGSGKSTAIDVMEDAGFYCVDNMPVSLLPKFLELPLQHNADIAGLAFVMDAREKSFITQHAGVFAALKADGHRLEIIFLEADEQDLLQRYSQTRRYHPLGRDKNLVESIQREKRDLTKLRTSADQIINTSGLTVHDLKQVIRTLIRHQNVTHMQIQILSFGFKYGAPHNADLVMDVRFLANPYFHPELKPLDGESTRVRDFVMADPNSGPFLEKYLGLLDDLIPLYEKEGKAYLTIAIGCTGGHHRSVAIARAVFEHIRRQGAEVQIAHRDIQRQAAESSFPDRETH